MKTISLKKKVAAVAVASLGLGLLSVVPAKAAIGATAFTINAPATATASVAVGAAASFDFTATTTGTPANGDAAFTITATIAKPSDSSAAVAAAGAATTTTGAFNMTKATNPGAWTIANSTNALTITPGAGVANLSAAALTTLTFIPDKPGVYVLTLTPSESDAATPTLTAASVTVYAGLSTDSVNPNNAKAIQGSNIVSAWGATANGQATVRLTNFAASTVYYVTTENASIQSVTERDSGTNLADAFTNGTNYSGGVKITTGAGTIPSDAEDIQILVGATGTAKVNVVYYNATTGLATTHSSSTVTIGVVPGPSAQYSLLTLNAGAGTTDTGAAADTTSTTVANTAGSKQFTIIAKVRDQYNVAFNGLVLGASITGPGTLGIAGTVNSSATSAGRSLTVTIADNDGEVTVFGDGTSGKSTITITATTAAGTVVLGTKTVTFAGSPATATVSQNLFVAQAGAQLGAAAATSTPAATSVATTAALRATIKDSNGVIVTSGRTVRIVSSDSTVIVAGACAELTVDGDIDVAGNQATPGVFECSVSGATGAASGKSATITFEVLNATTGLYDIKATPITFKIGGAIAAVAVSFDKATYTPGAAMNLTATATDSAGNAAYDGQAPYASIAGNMAVGGSLPATTKQIVNGKLSTTGAAATLFAPANTGTYTVSGLTIGTATDPAGKAWSASTNISGAVDAQIASLIAAIAKLQKAINKIQKRLNR